MSSDVQTTDSGITITSGLFDTDDGITLQVAGDAHPRVRITPQGGLLRGNGTATPTAPTTEDLTFTAPLVNTAGTVAIDTSDATLGDVLTAPSTPGDPPVFAAPATNEFVVAGILASDLDVSGGAFTTINLLAADGSTIVPDVPRAGAIGLSAILLTGANVGLWTITASGPCTRLSPQPLAGDSVNVTTANAVLLGTVGSGVPGTTVTAYSLPISRLSTSNPTALGVAASGTSSDGARIDHVHPVPSSGTLVTALSGVVGASGKTTVTGGTLGVGATDITVTLSRTLPDTAYVAIPFIQVGASGYADLLTLSCRVKTQNTTTVVVTVNNTAVGAVAASTELRVIAAY